MASMKPFGSLSRISRRTLADEITENLRDATRAGQIPLGTRLYENEIAAQMGVSRVPVREAIRRLSAEGLVKTIPHRGTFVYQPTRRESRRLGPFVFCWSNLSWNGFWLAGPPNAKPGLPTS